MKCRSKRLRRLLKSSGDWAMIAPHTKPHRNRDRILGSHERWSDLGRWLELHGTMPRDVLAYLSLCQFMGREFACERVT